MEPEENDMEGKPLMMETPEEEKTTDRFDEFSNFKGIDRKEFLDKDGQYYWAQNGYDDSEARDENFFWSICLCTCPRIGWLQFIVLVSLLEIVVFIISCSIYGLTNDEFLSPNPHALEIMGWQDSKKIKNQYQLWRWFTPIFLHGNFEHIVGNVLAQLFMGSGIEYGIGFLKMTLLYLITGFGGNLLSSVMNPAAYGVGASTAVFGLVGFYVAYIFTNWQFMGRVGWGQRVFLILYTSIMIVLNFAKSDPKVDNWGHLGGLITGIFAGFAISEWFDAEARSKERIPDRFTEIEYENKYCCCKVCSKIRVGTIFLFLWLFALLVLFYTVVDVNVEQGNIDDDT